MSEAGSAARPVALSSYELLGKLARGGMGTVYVARRAGAAGFQRLFAVKLMHEHLADHEEFVQMFMDEARLAARLHHPNVVAIVDTGEIEGRQFVVMDYVEGCSLQQLLKLSPDNRPLRSVVSIFNDFLLGLHAAHELRGDDGQPLNLVHRDVSPQNVLVGLDGTGRITDFGIAKAEARLTSTRPGLRKGKLAFMAPEQLYDEGIDRRADIFSSGAMLWSTLTGEKLFAGSSDAATMRNLLQMEIKPPSTVGLKPPSYFDEVCLRALAKKPEDRFQTAAEFADALRSLAMEHNLFGSSADVATWIRNVAGDKLDDRRRALGNTTSDSAVHSMPVLVEAPSSFSRSAITSATGQIRRRKKRTRLLFLLALLGVAIIAGVVAAIMTRDPGSQNGGATAREQVPESPAPEAPAGVQAEKRPAAVGTEVNGERPGPSDSTGVAPSTPAVGVTVTAEPTAQPRMVPLSPVGPRRGTRRIPRWSPMTGTTSVAVDELPTPAMDTQLPEAPPPPASNTGMASPDIEFESNPYTRR